MSLVGANGTGKTTLITALAGLRELDGGKLRSGHNVKLGLLSQHAEEMGSTGTVLEATQRATKLTPNHARSLLGRFLFSGEEAEKPLDGLQRRRAAAAVAGDPRPLGRERPDPRRAHQPPGPREPRGAGEALQGYQGALLLISHDRALLDAVGTRTVALEDQTLHSYVGGWPEYVRVREERAEAARTAKRTKPVVAKAAPAPVAAAPAKPIRSKNEQARAKKLEAQIEKAEAALAALEIELADPSAWNDPSTSAKSTARHTDAKKTLENLYAQWESVAQLGQLADAASRGAVARADPPGLVVDQGRLGRVGVAGAERTGLAQAARSRGRTVPAARRRCGRRAARRDRRAG